MLDDARAPDVPLLRQWLLLLAGSIALQTGDDAALGLRRLQALESDADLPFDLRRMVEERLAGRRPSDVLAGSSPPPADPQAQVEEVARFLDPIGPP